MIEITQEDKSKFLQRLVGTSLFHITERGLSTRFGVKFKSLGIGGINEKTKVDKFVVDAINEREIAETLPGPYLLVPNKAEAQTELIDYQDLLLSSSLDERRAILSHIRHDMSWLQAATVDCINQNAADIRSKNEERWRDAAFAIIRSVETDMVADVHALNQCREIRFQEGSRKYYLKVIRPNLSSLSRIRPPFWSTTEQSLDLSTQISEWAQTENFESAFEKFCKFCGFLPLAYDFALKCFVDRWKKSNKKSIEWMTLSRRFKNDFVATYHLTCLAVNEPNAFDDGKELNVAEIVLDFLAASERNDDDFKLLNLQHRIFCLLATHYLNHIESIFPGQDGETLAIAANWIASLVTPGLCDSIESAEQFLNSFLIPDTSW